MKTNLFVTKIALSGEGGISHEHATYLRRLMEVIRHAVRSSKNENFRIAEGLAAADALLAQYQEIE